MILSTLSILPGQTFVVMGFVYADATLRSLGGGSLQKMVQTLMRQAQQFGANGIIDIKTTGAGDSGIFVMTGTAIKIQ
jgi:uncharacterized protein YbjQ (UPF0145 family)